MGDKTAIEWADATWNPIRGTSGRWSCVKISPGCTNCYAERFNVRLGGPKYVVGADTLRLDEDALTHPLRWKRPRRIFVCSMTDLFEERVSDEWILQVFDVMTKCNGMYADSPSPHTFLVLTKRAQRMRDFMEKLIAAKGTDWLQAHGHRIWLGVSAENQPYADERIPWLFQTPAVVRFLSLEPLLGPIDLKACLDIAKIKIPGIGGMAPRTLRGGRSYVDWVITGGESGGPPERALVRRCTGGGGTHGCLGRSCHSCRGALWVPKAEALEWVRAVRAQCVAAGVPFFFKQWGGPIPKSGGRLLDGREWDEYSLPALNTEMKPFTEPYRYCKYCGAKLKRDAVGRYCPSKNCQWSKGVPDDDA